MSWGERSCKNHMSCIENPIMCGCDVKCPFYTWDGETEPDSVSLKEEMEVDDV